MTKDEMLEWAWGLICNASNRTIDNGGPVDATPGWADAAKRWRDDYHAMIAEERWRWLQSTLDLQMKSFGYDFPMTGEELGDFVRTNITALVAELGEALKEIGWKPWSVGQGYVNREAYLGELVDAGHFLANLLVAVGITDEEWEAAYQRKQQVNRERQAAGYDTRAAKCPACGRAYDDAATQCNPEQPSDDASLGLVPYCEDYGVLTTTGK